MNVDTRVTVSLTLEEAKDLRFVLDSFEGELPDVVDTLLVQLP